MLKTIICVFLLSGSSALPYGKVFPTRLPTTNTYSYSRLVVKNISELPEFEDIVSEVDNTRRMLELREGVETAKEKYSQRFTFKCICGTTYASVFGNQKK